MCKGRLRPRTLVSYSCLLYTSLGLRPHHRGRLQLDLVFPNRTGCLPRHDVNTQKRPCSGSAERGRSVSKIQQGPRLALAATPEGVLLFGVLLWCEEESCARGGCGPAPL